MIPCLEKWSVYPMCVPAPKHPENTKSPTPNSHPGGPCQDYEYSVQRRRLSARHTAQTGKDAVVLACLGGSKSKLRARACTPHSPAFTVVSYPAEHIRTREGKVGGMYIDKAAHNIKALGEGRARRAYKKMVCSCDLLICPGIFAYLGAEKRLFSIRRAELKEG